MLNKKILASVAVLSILGGAAVWCVAQEQPAADAGLQELMARRVKVLRDLSERLELAYKQGGIALDDYLDKKNELLDAELELAANGTDRTEIRRRFLASMDQLERMIELGVDAGKFVEADLLTATAVRLEAEIELRRERDTKATK